MRVAAEGVRTSGRATAALAAAAAAISGCALLFSNGSSPDPLVWIGGAALLAAGLAAAALALGALPAVEIPAPGLAFLGCLAGLTVWMGVSVLWSTEPQQSWQYTNRMLAYLAFATLGVVVGSLLPRASELVAGTLAGLLALVFGWALLAKAVPGLYPDYARVARLRSPVEYWNELALLADVGVGLALWLAAPRTRRPEVRAAGAALLYAAALVVLLTYSRFGIALAVAVAVLWVLLDRDRVESLAALALAGIPAVGVFLFALSLPGIADDAQTHAQRVHDGWRFGLVAAVGLLLVAALTLAVVRVEERRPLAAPRRAQIERAALWAGALAAVACVVLAIVFAGRIWHQFTAHQQVTNAGKRLSELGSSNRWTWWKQAWHAFVDHPLGGTGAATFDLTNRLHRASSFDIATEPHNVPLQFLSETGIVGLLLFLGAAGAAIAAILRRRRAAAVTALGLGLAAWLAHMVADMDWSYVAVCGPLLFVAGSLVGGRVSGPSAPRRRPLAAVAALAVAAVAVYSLVAPRLASRQYDLALAALPNVPAALAHAKSAHGYDPLSVDALLLWATLEPRPAQARDLYRKAVRLEPLDPDAWYQLGAFEYQQGRYVAAYLALDRSWGLDRHGPAAVKCDYLDLVRPRVTGYGVSCRGFRQPASP